MKCETCGTQLRAESAACANCGATVAVPGETVAMAASGGVASRQSAAAVSRLTAPTPDEGRFLPGTLIAGRYRVIGLLGRGGMGEVYRATDLTLAQSVALKFLPEEAVANERLLERFHNEVRVARQVSHPNVCRVYDIGEADSHPFISMEYVDGEDLASLLQRIGRLPPDKALDIARRLCAGVAAAHERGIIHRDLKPHNVMLNRRGEVVIMDFGLAAVADELRGAEARNGTPAYMAPEQLRGDAATPKSDIYALGLLIYELFTGKRAWEASSIPELVRQQESGRPLSLTTLVADADPAVEKVLLRCLDPDPARRPASALSVAAALPGGDPLAAALAAGETPSPDLVAAAGRTEGIRARYAAACLLLSLLILVAAPIAAGHVAMLAFSPVRHPPAVLQTKARELAASFGYTRPPADSAGWYSVNDDYTGHLLRRPGDKKWREWFVAEEPFRYTYRESPRELTSEPDGGLSSQRPPMTEPGMVAVTTDAAGRLRSFQAVAPRYDSAPETRAFDPVPVFRAAGFDVAQFQATAPEYLPPLAYDARQAWSGAHPALPECPLRIETATYAGRLVSFHIVWPWDRRGAPQVDDRPLAARLLGLLSLLLAVSGFGFALWFARVNIKAARGDRRGALRLAAAYFVLTTISWAMRQHIMPDLSLIGYAFHGIGFNLFFATLIWLLYIALEPAVRARWPQSLITWNRVLAGSVLDARVGSHILIGATMGSVLYALLAWRYWWAIAAGNATPDAPSLQTLNGVRGFLASVSGTASNAIMTGLIIFFLLCGVRAVLRIDWLAAVAASVLLALQQTDVRMSVSWWIDVPVFVAVFAAFAFLLLRMGLVPAIAAILVINLLSGAPLGGDIRAWTTGPALTLMLIVAAVPLFGFWRSQSRESHPGTA